MKIKQLAAIATLIGVIFVGFGGLFGHESYRVSKEGVIPIVEWIADRLQNVGSFFMVIAPVILIISDWRNIFPSKESRK